MKHIATQIVVTLACSVAGSAIGYAILPSTITANITLSDFTLIVLTQVICSIMLCKSKKVTK